MKITTRCTPFLGAFALLGPATSVTAQSTSVNVLNQLEVRKLVVSGDAGDQRRLAAHFAVLAERYTSLAKRHATPPRLPVGNPNHPTEDGRGARFRRLAALDTQAATVVRALAVHYGRLADGVPSASPPDGARFERGEGAPDPSPQELSALSAAARTVADHRRLATYYSGRAEQLAAEVRTHGLMASSYRATKIAAAAVHCDRLISEARGAWKEIAAAERKERDLAEPTPEDGRRSSSHGISIESPGLK